MYELYEVCKEQYTFYSARCKHTEIEVIRPSCQYSEKTLKKLVVNLYWNLITLGKAKIYLIRDDEGTLIHSSYVIPKCYKFPFLRGGGYHDIEIGPCVTAAAYRGQGLYPYVLSRILEKELEANDKAYMIVDDKNIASKRGVQKVGFVCMAKIRKNRFKKYIITEKYDVDDK